MQKKSLFTSFLLGLLVFGVIAWVLGPKEMLVLLQRMDPKYLAAALAINALAMMAMTCRWRVFVRAAGEKTSYKDLLLITLAGTALNNITPSTRMGGEPLRAYLLKKRGGVRTSTGLATIVVEKIVDMAAFSLITLAAIIYSLYFLNIPGHTIALLALSFLFAAAIASGLLYVTLRKKIKPKWILAVMDRYQKWAGKVPVVSYYRERMDEALKNYYSYASKIARKGVLVKGILWSLAYWSMEIARAYAIFLAFGMQPPLAVIAAVYVLANIVGSLPLPPGSLEATMIVIYSSAAINTVAAGAVTIIDRLISFWLVILLGIPVGWHLGTERK